MVFSRFGTMFFSSPVLALRNLRRSLTPGGRSMMITWRSIEDNDWLGLAKGVVREFLPPPPDDGRTCGPGPFSLASEDVVRSIVGAAGFNDIELIRNDVVMPVGRTIDEAIDMQLALGPAGEIVREAGELGSRREPEIRAALTTELAPFQREDGSVWLPSSSWTTTARNPSTLNS